MYFRGRTSHSSGIFMNLVLIELFRRRVPPFLWELKWWH
uniref:Uncharacterized protein n=1 Tax=Anguilla anguilla TaxID=7936 RepID=A0A0E9V403_ANGAN